uniref:RNA-directed DNA polymerase n=1 Tax=Phytophthora ramorum TaxID=164328 RepID=H3H3R4_PHYRM
MVEQGDSREEGDAEYEERPVNEGYEGDTSSDEEVGEQDDEEEEKRPTLAGRRTEQSSVMRELMEEEKEDPDRQVKIEPGVKEEGELRAGAEQGGGRPSERRRSDRDRSQDPDQAYDSEEYGSYGEEEYVGEFYSDDEVPEIEDVPLARSPSGFIPRYSGPEARQPNRPVFGWSYWSSQPTVARTGGRRSSGEELGTRKSLARSKGPVNRAYAGATGTPNKNSGTHGTRGQQVKSTASKNRPRQGPVPTARTRQRTVASRSSLATSAYGLSTLVSNAVKVLPMFYSDTATVEKARDFWDMFAVHTDGLPDSSRLLVFRQKLKGREAERWWGNSRIKTFDTLKLRFHNQFLSRTADELWERLETTKRERGESVEEWGDRVSDLCESLNYPNPQMRYQLFRRGLRNKRMLATLDSGPASDIPEACEWLMFKDMYRPVEEDEEFSDEGPSKKKEKETPVLASVDALAQRLQSFMDQQQLWQQQLQADRYHPSRSPRNRSPVAAVTTGPPPMPTVQQGSGRRLRGISMADDNRTQDGIPDKRERNDEVNAVVEVKEEDENGTVKAGTVEITRSVEREERIAKSILEDDEGGTPAIVPAEGKIATASKGTGMNVLPATAVKETKRVNVAIETTTEREVTPVAGKKKFEKMAVDEKKEVDPVLARTVTISEKKPVVRPTVQPRSILRVGGRFYVPRDEDVWSSEEEDWDDGFDDFGETLFSKWTLESEREEEPCASVTEKSKDEGLSEKTIDAEEDEPRYARLFTDCELDALEECKPGSEATVLAGTETLPEAEEYEKELEDRLYPLDEVEIKRRMKQNADSAKEPSLGDMARYLDIPLDVLERTRTASLDGTTSPEYWQDWFRDTLESSEEAKRANRDFRKAETVPSAVAASADNVEVREGKVSIADEGVSSKSSGRDGNEGTVGTYVEELNEKLTDERTVLENVLLVTDAEASSADEFMTGLLNRKVVNPAASAEELGSVLLRPEREEDVSHYVQMISPCRPFTSRAKRTGLAETVTVNLPRGFGIQGGEEEVEPLRVEKSGRRVVCSVGSYEALSGGFIDCLPSHMLADTGATLSLVDKLVMRRLGRSTERLEPYDGRVNSSSGHPVRIRGWTSLPVRLGSMEISLRVLVAHNLHVDAILGVDALGAFGAVIDVAERTMTLKLTGEVLSLGAAVVHDSFMATMATSVRLPPHGQALVTTEVVGEVDDQSTVLIEGSLGLPPTLCVARSLCTIEKGKVIVEICNATTDEIWIRKGTVVASTSVIPESAFSFEKLRADDEPVLEIVPAEDRPPDTVKSVAEEPTERVAQKERASKPEVPPDKGGNMKADFSQSKLSAEQKALFQTELNRFDSLFVESSKAPGRTDLLNFRIDTGPNAPIKQQPYRVSVAEGEVMEAEIQQYLELGIIRPSISPWASPVLMIRKPDGGIRFCIDYRRLNSVTVKDCYPMPLIDDILDVLGDAQLFSTMDIASGYWNVPMDEDSIAKTAFTCKYGLYEWMVMPFGLCNAVPAFERLMETVLVDLKWRICLVYLDDCVIFSKDFPSHLVRVRQVLTRFQQAGFKLKMKKCHWGRNQVAFLGHIVTPTGILPNPEKVKAVMNVARPQDVHGIRSFLGLTSYFRRYIPGYASISAPLERLKVKDAPFDWNADCEAAFRQLKRALVKPPILIYPNSKRRFKLFVDSSRYAVGACLMQEANGRDRVVAYASKLLTGSQKNWINKTDGISEIECWGVVWATRKFRCYLDKREFDLYTDHQALTWVFNPGNRTTNAKLARWAMELSNLQFKVQHKPGTMMGHVDGLSRLPTNSVNALTLADLLNPVEIADNETLNLVGEPHEPEGLSGGPYEGDIDTEEKREESDEEQADVNHGPGEDGPGLDASCPSVDMFGLDSEQFWMEQQSVSWIKALVAFLINHALPLDPFLRARVVKLAPKFDASGGLLMRHGLTLLSFGFTVFTLGAHEDFGESTPTRLLAWMAEGRRRVYKRVQQVWKR